MTVAVFVCFGWSELDCLFEISPMCVRCAEFEKVYFFYYINHKSNHINSNYSQVGIQLLQKCNKSPLFKWVFS